MNASLTKGLLVAAIHVAIVSSLGAKLLVDRHTRPRVWARTAPVDPNLPIRGRYVSLRLEAELGGGLTLPPPQPRSFPNGTTWTPPAQAVPITLSVSDGQLVALPAGQASSDFARGSQRGGRAVALLEPPVAYFIPEHAADPSRRAPGEELWVEVTIPRSGPPRPIRLGVKKDGAITPLDLR